MRHTATPAPLLDVVRAALGEVDDYSMVQVAGVRPATIAGTVVADLSHLLAELIENALRASFPGVPVEVRGHAGGDAYVLGIVDRGRGMRDQELASANARLSRADGHDVAPARHLGLYVTAVLAARHGIGVRLQGTPGGGTTAVVRLPATVLVPEEPTPAHDRLASVSMTIDPTQPPLPAPAGWLQPFPGQAPSPPPPVPPTPPLTRR
jgi:signal transduction histidine kinase